jgi:Family of unknown function (DUF5317)
MVYLNFTIAGLACGLLLGGKLSTLGRLPVRHLELAYAAVALQVAAFPSNVLPWSTPDSVARPLWLCSYTLLLALVYLNRRITGFILVGVGIVSNLTAILSNGGLMPAKPSALRAAGVSFNLHNNSVKIAQPHLAWLVDRFAWPTWLPLANVFSVGDILIGLGLLAIILAGMQPRLLARVPGFAERAAQA